MAQDLNLYHIPNTSDDNSQEIQDIVDKLGSSKSSSGGSSSTSSNSSSTSSNSSSNSSIRAQLDALYNQYSSGEITMAEYNVRKVPLQTALMSTSGTSTSTSTQSNGITEQAVRDIVNQHLSTGVTEDRVRALIESTSRFKTGMNILMDGYLKSQNFYTGVSGWQIDADGNVEFGSGYFRGDITGASGTFTGTLIATTGVIGGFTITATELYGGIIKTAATVGAGNNGVIMDSAGLRGYDSILGKVFDIHTDGSAPEFAFGNISNSIFEINTNAILRTSATVGDGSASSAGILINNTGLYATEANQTLANANVKILIDGSAVIKMNVKGGQTDFNTGTGYFLGLSGGDYKFSIGSAASNYMTWDGQYLKIKGSFDIGDNGLINNSVYTVATLPIAPTIVGFNVPSAYE